MIGINGKSWNELNATDIQAVLDSTREDKSIFDESVFFEFKSDQESPSKFVKEVCAFSNTFGGYIFMGIEDDHSISGCDRWNEQRIHSTIFDSISPTPQIDVKRFIIHDLTVLIVKIEEGAVPPYITNEGKIYCRLSSGSFPIKDATMLSRLIDKRRDTMRMISEKTEINPVEIGRDTPTNLCAYIDVGFATTLSESSDAQLNRFDHLNYDSLADILKKYTKDFGISRIGTSLFFTIGNMTAHREDGLVQVLGAGIQFFMELMIDGSVRYRIPLSYDADSKMGSCNITEINTIVVAFTDIYEQVFGKQFAEIFVCAHKYQKLTVLKQFRPYYYLGEQNDPEIVKRIRALESLHKEKYGSNVVVAGNRIPPNNYTLIDKHLFDEYHIPFDSHGLSAVLLSTAYGNLGFIEDPFSNVELTEQ